MGSTVGMPSPCSASVGTVSRSTCTGAYSANIANAVEGFGQGEEEEEEPRDSDTSTSSESFEELLKRLASVHESQQEAIKKLTAENAALRTKAKRETACFDLLRRGDSMRRSTTETVAAVDPDRGLDTKDIELRADPSYDRFNSDLSHTVSGWPIPEMWEDWEHKEGEFQHVITRTSISHMCVVEDTTGQAMTMVNRCYQKVIVRPNSPFRLVWDLLSGIMVCYDVISIPLMAISLDSDEVLGGGQGQFTHVMDWITTTFWTMDIPWSFLTGYHSEGVVEMRAHRIFLHYLKTWCSFDVLIIVVDWVIVYTASRSVHTLGLFRVGKTARVARILRAVRLLRFVKLQRALVEALELINSQSLRAGFNILLAVLFIFAINHYLACGWYFVGHVNWSMGNPNWIQENKIPENSVAYAYFTSLHWSLTQFTPASMEIRPFNLGERVYAIVCLMFALITFSSFLGSITASITQLRKHTTEAGRQQSILRSYFHKNKVSGDLSKAIWSFLVKNHFSQQTRSHSAKIAVLELLPHNLQSRLHQELYGPYITRAPFFYHYVAFSSDAVMEVCHQAAMERALVCNDELFQDGKVAEKMYFVASGTLRYEHFHARHSQNIGTGSWIAEPVLWVKWVHVASLRAVTTAEIISLDSEKFRSTTALFKNSFPFVKSYAKLFCEYLHEIGSDHQTDLLTNVMALEALTRQAWYNVSSRRDHEFYTEMPNKEFPHVSRHERIRSLIWHEPVRVPFWQRASAVTRTVGVRMSGRAGKDAA